MLEIKNLKKTYNSKGGEYLALQDVSMKVKKGEFVSVMGPSGSGKTTLLNCISGFIGGNSGEILLDGENILNIDENKLSEIRQNKLGFVFQDFMLINGLTVLENIFLPQIIAKKTLENMESKSELLLNTFGINEIKNKYPNEISGGQKQRVAIRFNWSYINSSRNYII
ncbi:ABC transporter ATP-binding protein [Clostridium sp.]|uniref:ABC transporter ATP-binding protein n=1 Tax=Clostridium sp. TaxID=1506 RepID=UPI003F2AFA3E